MKYYSFNWIQYSNGQMKNSGESYYYTNADVNIDEMKDVVKTTALNDLSAVLTVQNIQPISKEFYEMKTAGFQHLK